MEKMFKEPLGSNSAICKARTFMRLPVRVSILVWRSPDESTFSLRRLLGGSLSGGGGAPTTGEVFDPSGIQ